MKCSIDMNDITICEFQGVTIGQNWFKNGCYIRKNRERISSPMQHGAQDKRCESKKEYFKIYVKKQMAS